MIILEVIAEFIIEVVFIDLIGGIISKINNAVLKLRGIETKTVDEIKLSKLRKRYENKTVVLKSSYNGFKKRSKGVVLEVIDKENAFVEFKDVDLEVVKVQINNILISK